MQDWLLSRSLLNSVRSFSVVAAAAAGVVKHISLPPLLAAGSIQFWPSWAAAQQVAAVPQRLLQHVRLHRRLPAHAQNELAARACVNQRRS
jgi:hypothetical protein